MTLAEYYERSGHRITQESESSSWTSSCIRLLAEKIGAIEPQYPFLDRTGRAGRIPRFPGHALTPTGVMAIRCKQFPSAGLIEDRRRRIAVDALR